MESGRLATAGGFRVSCDYNFGEGFMKARNPYKVNFEIYDIRTDSYILKMKKWRWDDFEKNLPSLRDKFK